MARPMPDVQLGGMIHPARPGFGLSILVGLAPVVLASTWLSDRAAWAVGADG
jgi:hypothetical protein